MTHPYRPPPPPGPRRRTARETVTHEAFVTLAAACALASECVGEALRTVWLGVLALPPIPAALLGAAFGAACAWRELRAEMVQP